MKREIKGIPGNPFLCKKGFPGPFPKNSNIMWLGSPVVTRGNRILRNTCDPRVRAAKTVAGCTAALQSYGSA